MSAKQSLDYSKITKFKGLSLCIKNLGKPYDGKPHVRFDEGSRETDAGCRKLHPCPAL
jgi:hypothetical protein